eukprot:2697813-Rhodomonas_salina.3
MPRFSTSVRASPPVLAFCYQLRPVSVMARLANTCRNLHGEINALGSALPVQFVRRLRFTVFDFASLLTRSLTHPFSLRSSPVNFPHARSPLVAAQYPVSTT